MATSAHLTRVSAAMAVAGVGVLFSVPAARAAALARDHPGVGTKLAARLKGPYQPTWESLKKQTTPKWYEDAKFGIFIHWGVYSVPAFGSEWYPRNMYRKGSSVYRYHREHFGPQSKFGYKDFIPRFKAEKWDPEAWADLFVKAGAKYVVPVAEHHDGFAMYDCSYTKWDAKEMGPCRDILGELFAACRKRGLKVGASTHRGFNSVYYVHSDEFDTNDPRYFGLYGRPPKRPWPDKQFLEQWLARTIEIVDKYRPDLMWFDFGFNRPPFEPYRIAFAAYYYNWAHRFGVLVIINYKGRAFPAEAAVLDIERGKLGDIRKLVWQTDTSVCRRSWGYIQNHDYRTVESLVGELVDIVSKNGCLLLNIGPRADGTIPEPQRQILLGIGRWLKVNGEAIYGSRPWSRFGEGPTQIAVGPHQERRHRGFSADDWRFTTKGGRLYAIALGWPKERFKVRSLGKKALGSFEVGKVEMLGLDEPLRWTQGDDRLTIQPPSKKPCEHAWTFRITLKGFGHGDLKLLHDARANQVTASVRLTNMNEQAWKHDVSLLVDGKVAATKPVTLQPQATDEVSFVHKLAGREPAYHRCAIRWPSGSTPERGILVPPIALAGRWRFKPGDDPDWKKPDLDDGTWQRVRLPAYWEKHSNYTKNPAFGWYRKRIRIPEGLRGMALVLPLGMIDDVDETFLNGVKIGGMGTFPPKWVSAFQQARRYRVPPALVRYGAENVIAIRVCDVRGDGGLYAGPLGPVELAPPRGVPH